MNASSQPDLATVHHLSQHRSWCNDHQRVGGVTWCSRRLIVGRVAVDVTAIDREPATISAVATSSSHIEDLTPAEAEQLAAALEIAAQIARGQV